MFVHIIYEPLICLSINDITHFIVALSYNCMSRRSVYFFFLLWTRWV